MEWRYWEQLPDWIVAGLPWLLALLVLRWAHKAFARPVRTEERIADSWERIERALSERGRD